MVQRIPPDQAQARVSEVLKAASLTEDAILLGEHGQPVAVLISPEEYQELLKARAFAAIDEIRAENADKDPDEVYADVTAVVEEVRQKRYDEQQRASGHP